MVQVLTLQELLNKGIFMGICLYLRAFEKLLLKRFWTACESEVISTHVSGVCSLSEPQINRCGCYVYHLTDHIPHSIIFMLCMEDKKSG